MRFFRKSLTVLFAVSIASLGVVSALSVLPHSHGADFDHSSHKDCAVHQVAQHPVQATAAAVVAFVVFAAFTILLQRPVFAARAVLPLHAYLRAPPAS